jgi:hypothetical protein
MKKTLNVQIEITEEFIELFAKKSDDNLDLLRKELNLNKSEELLSRQEAYEFLKIDSSTLWAHTQKKRLKAYGLGNKIYYMKSELLAALTLKE